METSVIAWHEYARGPLLPEDQARTARLLEDRIVALTRQMAELAAHLFNETGRGRASTADCFIAAAAIKAEAKLLTDNVADFERCTEFHVCEIFSQMSGDAAGVREGRLAVSF